MDKIKLLQSRREQVLAAGTEIRKTISSLIDADSFVELSGFSFFEKRIFRFRSGRGRRCDRLRDHCRVSRLYCGPKFCRSTRRSRRLDAKRC